MVVQELPLAYRHLSVADLGEVIVVRLDQQCFDGAFLREVVEEMDRVVDRADCRRVVLNFSAVVRFPSLLLGKLLVWSRRLADRRGKLFLCEVRPEVQAVFAKTRLDEILHIRDSEVNAF
jgi:anti-anti-sigma factor